MTSNNFMEKIVQDSIKNSIAPAEELLKMTKELDEKMETIRRAMVTAATIDSSCLWLFHYCESASNEVASLRISLKMLITQLKEHDV